MNDIRFDVGISLLPGLRSAERLMLSEIIPDLRELLRLGRFDLQALIGRRLHFENEQLLNIEKDIEEVIQGVKALGASIISYWDSRYPVLLREIYDPPYLLYLRGSLPAPADPAVAVVGTRKDDPSSIAAAFSFPQSWRSLPFPLFRGLPGESIGPPMKGPSAVGATPLRFLVQVSIASIQRPIIGLRNAFSPRAGACQ